MGKREQIKELETEISELLQERARLYELIRTEGCHLVGVSCSDVSLNNAIREEYKKNSRRIVGCYC